MLGGLMHGTRGTRRFARVQRPCAPSAEDGRRIREVAAGLLGREGARGAERMASSPKYLESLQWVERRTRLMVGALARFRARRWQRGAKYRPAPVGHSQGAQAGV